jgi:phosphotriesterase-related protein
MQRRTFLRTFAATLAAPHLLRVGRAEDVTGKILTVRGPIKPDDFGTVLIHEHVLVDFIGADKITPDRYRRDDVVARVLPFLREIRALGVQSLVECTPAYLGRDPVLLKTLSEQSGLHLLTNTGYYAAAGNKFLPPQAYTETAEQLAQRWIREFREGIDSTGIRPGHMKISVNAPKRTLEELDRKIVTAAGLTHRQTGLTITSHTGLAQPAREQLDLLRGLGVGPAAFIWTHAQAEAFTNKTLEPYAELAQRGAWVSLDGVGDDNAGTYAEILLFLKEKNLLTRVLLSHDAGWYRPGEPNGGEFRPFTAIFKVLLPKLREQGFSESNVRQLLVKNPAEAFTIRIRMA